MNYQNKHHELYARQMHAEALHSDLLAPPVSSIEQASIDRRAFLARQAFVGLVPECLPEPPATKITIENADRLIEKIIPQLSAQYHWLERVDRQQLADLFNEIADFRDTYAKEHDKPPSDGRIYRQYRLALEQAEDEAHDELYEKVVLLEALMDGNIVKGSLPSLDTYISR